MDNHFEITNPPQFFQNNKLRASLKGEWTPTDETSQGYLYARNDRATPYFFH